MNRAIIIDFSCFLKRFSMPIQRPEQTTAEDSMQIVIHARDFSLTDAIRRHAERRLRSALSCYDQHIQRVVMRLTGDSSERCGAGNCCHVQVQLAGLPDVVVQDIGTDLYVAMGRAAHRAGRTIKRRLVRRRDKARNTSLPDTAAMTERFETTLSN